jgi:hypothetical protein
MEGIEMKIKLLVVGFLLMFLNGTVVLADLDPLENYDNFNTKKVNGCKFCINSEKWRGLQRGNYTMEVTREIKAKRAHLSHRSWGTADDDGSSEQGRNRLNFRDSANFSGACFTPRVKKYELNSCEANTESSGSVRIRYLGTFYDTDNVDDAGEEDGLIYAGISLRRGNWTDDKKGIFEISGNVEECEGAGCGTDAWSTYDDFGFEDPDLFLGSVKASANKKAMCVGYDRANHEMVFSFGNKVRVVNAADHGLPAFGDNVDADWSWHVIETRTDVENCTDGPQTGFIDADFDNVKVREYQ